MKILFVTNVMHGFLGFAPMGIMYLSSSLKTRGHRTKLVDANAREIFRACRDFEPDVIGYSVTTGFQDHFLNVNREIKKSLGSDIFSIFGGPHPTYFPEIVFEDGVDAIFLGESESALLDFVERLENKKELYSVKNVWMRDFGTPGLVHKNPPGDLVDDLDTIPFADRDIVNDYQGRPINFHPFIANRGCPYNCSYCFNASFRRLYQGRGEPVRRRTVDNLIEEMLVVKRSYPMDFVYFIDDEFSASLEWIEEFVIEYKKNIGVNFSCSFRPNRVSEDKIRLLKGAGLTSVSMAFEAADDYVRKRILNRNLSKETLLRAARIVKSNGVFLEIQNMVGIPGAGLEKDFETLKLNVDAKPDYAWVSICAPYPGTELGQYAKEIGCFDGDFSRIGPTIHLSSALKISNKREVENLHKLFAIIVKYPFFMAPAKFLIRLPLGGFYSILRKLFRGYVSYKMNRFGVKFTLKDQIKCGFQFITKVGG